MSTKCTIAYSNDADTDFHFYKECFDDDHVYLELRTNELEYEVSNGRAMVRIPIEIWDVIRRCHPADTRFAGMTDEALEGFVREVVDEDIARMQKHVEDYGWEKAQRIRVFRLFGNAKEDDTRETQIEAGLEHYRRVREEHNERRQKIERLLEVNKNA